MPSATPAPGARRPVAPKSSNVSEAVRGPARPALRRAVGAVVEALETRRLLATVTIDTGEEFQTIGGLGGNYAKGRRTGQWYVNDDVGRFTLENLNPAHARVGIPLKVWEPVNDDADPNTRGTFNRHRDVNNVFLLMKDLSDRGIPVTASVWDAPDWMNTNPTAANKKVVYEELYPELVESITAFLTTARDEYGVTVDYVSFNEADGGYFQLFTAAQNANIIKMSGPVFEANGLSTKWLVADSASPNTLYNYAKAILEDADALPYTGPVSYHSWNALTYSDSVFTRIYDLASQYGKEVWVEELGYDADLYYNPGNFKTWLNATSLARTYHRVLVQSRASVVDYWEYMNDYPLVDPNTLAPYPAYHIVKELSDGLRPGARMIEADSNDSAVWALAAKHVPNDQFMLQLINTAASSKLVTINGLPSTNLELVRSSAAGAGVKVGTYVPSEGKLTLTLPADSVGVLKGRLAVPAPWSNGDVGNATGGTALFDQGTFRLRGSGAGFRDHSDGFHFVSQPAAANETILARVDEVGPGGEAGVMIREGLGAADRFVALTLDANGYARLRVRTAVGADADLEAFVTDLHAPRYLRLTREGETFTGAVSADGLEWTTIDSYTLALGGQTRVGLALTSNYSAGVATAAFADVAAAALPVTLAPDRPAAVAATGFRVDVSWGDNSGNETGFEIERSADGVTFERVGTVGRNVPRFTDATVTPNLAYFYRVRAIGPVGNSAYSRTVRVRTPGHYEAEDARRSSTVIGSSQGGFTGTGYVDFTAKTGAWLEWTVDAPYDGPFGLDFRYAMTSTRAVELRVDGQVVDPALSFTKTPYLTSWTEKRVVVDLSRGQHTVRLTTTGQEGPNVDHLELHPLTPATPDLVGRASGGKVRLTWTDNPHTGTDQYVIERSLDGLTWDQVLVTEPNASSYTDASAQVLVPYYYQVRAFNHAGDSGWSDAVLVTIPLPPAAPGSLVATAASQTSVKLTWQDLSDNEDAFQVEYSTDGVNFRMIQALASGSKTYTATNLPIGAWHYFRVRTVNGGGSSDYTAPAAALTPISTPSGLSAEAAGPHSVELDWDGVAGAVAYAIERAPAGSDAWEQVGTSDGSSFEDDGAADGTRYAYRVRALGPAAVSDPTGTVEVLTPLPAPSSLHATVVTRRRIDLTWTDAATAEDAYVVEHSTDGQSFFELARLGADATAYTHAGMFAPDAVQYYRVRAVATATGLASPYATDQVTAPGANQAPVADAGDDQVVAEGATVRFDGSFTDVDIPLGDAHTYVWDFGDGSTLVAGTLAPDHVYRDNGTYTATLTVTDDDGLTATDDVVVTVNNVAPVVAVASTVAGQVGKPVQFSAVVTDPGAADTHAIVWDFGDGKTATGTLKPTNTYAASGTYAAKVTVTDDDGAATTANVTVNVDTVGVAIPVTESTFVQGGTSAAKNFGASPLMEVKTSSSSDTRREGFLKLDLSSVSSIKNAKLRLWGKLDQSASSGVKLNVYNARSTWWDENTLTYGTKPSNYTTIHTTVTVTTTTARWYEIDLTALLKAEKAAGRNLVTLVFKGAVNTAARAQFNSDDASTNRPELVIES